MKKITIEIAPSIHFQKVAIKLETELDSPTLQDDINNIKTIAWKELREMAETAQIHEAKPQTQPISQNNIAYPAQPQMPITPKLAFYKNGPQTGHPVFTKDGVHLSTIDFQKILNYNRINRLAGPNKIWPNHLTKAQLDQLA